MKFIIPIIVGAIIGYITNWLAIKMLFRPYEKKYILGLPLPFTPGLIPKEQKRIAKSVGDTVGSYLLSEDIIMEHIEKVRLDEKIEKKIKELVERIKNSEVDIKSIFSYFDIGEYQDIKIKISNKSLSLIMGYLENEKNKEKILNSIFEILDRVDYEGEVIKLKEIFLEKLEDLENSKEIENLLNNYIKDIIEKLKEEDREIKEIIDIEKVNEIINKYSFIIVDVIKDCIDDFTIADRVKNLLNSLIEENMSKAIRMFLAPDLISERIYRIVESYIYGDDFEEKLRPILISGAEKLMEYKVSDIVGEFEKNISDEKINSWTNFLVDKVMTEKNKEILGNKFKKEVLKRENIFKDAIRLKASNYYDQLLKDNYFRLKIYNFVSNSLDRISRIKLSDLLNRVDSKYIDIISKKLSDIVVYLINTKVPKMLSLFNVSKVVEDEINKFEVDFAEEVILDIARKELEAITWLGALLGAIMGVISPLLQMI